MSKFFIFLMCIFSSSVYASASGNHQYSDLGFGKKFEQFFDSLYSPKSGPLPPGGHVYYRNAAKFLHRNGFSYDEARAQLGLLGRNCSCAEEFAWRFIDFKKQRAELMAEEKRMQEQRELQRLAQEERIAQERERLWRDSEERLDAEVAFFTSMMSRLKNKQK